MHELYFSLYNYQSFFLRLIENQSIFECITYSNLKRNGIISSSYIKDLIFLNKKEIFNIFKNIIGKDNQI